MVTRDGLVYGLPEAEYHAPKDELSSTGAKLILDAPARFKHVVLDGNQEHKDSYDLGSIVHAKVLGTGWGVEVLDFENWRTKASQEAKAAARAAGLIPMLRHEVEKPNAIAEAVLANRDAAALFERDGASEVSAFATCPETGVRVRARADRFCGPIVDLKTTAGSAKPEDFARTAFKFGYDLQDAMYEDVFRWASGWDDEFKFVVVETRAPYLVSVCTLRSDFIDMGRDKALKARRVYAECMAAGIWPGYPSGEHVVEPPMAAVYDYQDNYESEEIHL
ncbi:PD-(D/E)XK nuclease-like domain-containing protein [Leucobacter allii]|uniref:PD-(D/E)XK nuclease-like domain-containing protein n=1 Tax=Leucobacter allii TaxID=2932247 RepID=A0ABY4FLT2_9MICO|nr:PD-(D/E)XK nuclease-like domain-containing protein [Leucobacter allii]UOQ57211.1 PD-(D/E)XK nuclease-like domain-containing protein [Leucobacter allii]